MVRSLWSDRPLGVKLAALVAAGTLALAAFALIAVTALRGAGERTHQLEAANSATGLALEADMMHDAVRGDVLQALLSGSGDQYQQAVADLTDHAQHLRDTLQRVSDAGLGADVGTAVAQVRPAVATYTAAAQQLVTLAGQDRPAAQASYPAFMEQFTALEAALPTVSRTVGQHAAEATAAADDQRSSATTELFAVAAAGVLVLGGLGRLVTRSVVGPLRQVARVVAGLAEGDLTGSTGIDQRDEVGQIAAAVEGSMADLRGVLTVVAESAATLATATGQLGATASGVAELAAESSARTGVVAAAAERVSGNVALVANGSAELGASIHSIARSASDVSQVAGEAVTLAGAATGAVAQLGSSSEAIAGVVAVITQIAEQTNLPVLNATIEAARATSDITARVEGIRSDTRAAVRAIEEIAGIIGRIDAAQGSIAAAVEEQTALTTETSRHVAEAATGAGQIAGTISAVATTAGTTTQAMADAQQAIGEVARRAAELHSALGRFRY